MDDFYAKIYNIWFQRWPIGGEWYSDQDHKDWAVDRHKKVSVTLGHIRQGLTCKQQIQQNIKWALLTNARDPDLGLTWQEGLELVVQCMENAARPKPRPLKRRAIDDADGAAARTTGEKLVFKER